MKQRNRNYKKALLLFSVGIVLFVLLFIFYEKHAELNALLHRFSGERKTETASEEQREETMKNDIMSQEQVLPEASQENDMMSSEPEEASEAAYEENDMMSSETQGERTEFMEQTKTVIEKEVYPADIYAEKNTEAVFQCYVPSATGYLWEYYDMDTMEWAAAEEETVSRQIDELGRNSSFYTVKAVPENHEKMIRCTIQFDERESIVKIASLHVLEKKIADISVEKTEYASGNILSKYEIPVIVTYEDESRESLTGLNGLHFVDEKEDTQYTNSVSGNRIETTTTVHTECEFLSLGAEEKEITVRYRRGEDCIDKETVICGKDYESPVISALEISEYEVSSEDKAVPVTVTITAEDNETPFPYLEYAFLPKNQEVTEDDWKQKFAFEVEITQNGTWVAYCRDQSGNVSSEERKIIAVDQKAPVISISLAENGWCNSNKILVAADDELPVEYLYSCPATGESSGWITYNEYQVSQNGIWNVQARDVAGNISSAEIAVENIDKQAPVIISIIEN